jgi:neurotransmitter:Na+ symporter, NSS family
VSLLAGIMVLCTVFSLMPDAAIADRRRRQRGAHVHLGAAAVRAHAGRQLFMVIFFVALFFAAISSLIAMIELATRVLRTWASARPRHHAVVGVGFLLGIPSALNQPTSSRTRTSSGASA